MPKILFLPEGTSLEVRDGITIQEAGRNAGLLLDAPCGGHGICKKCKVRIRREENEEPQDVLSCQYRVHEDLIVEHFEGGDKAAILTEGRKALFSVQPVKNGAFHMAVDIGTTTVVVYMLHEGTGEILGTKSRLNPQYPYGSDVISRIQKAVKGDFESMRYQIRKGIWEMIAELCRENKCNPFEMGTLSVVGNPAMQQLFLGIDLDNLIHPPFSAVLHEPQIRKLEEIYPLCSETVLLSIPDIAGFVGADTLGCVLSTDLWRKEERTLMIDIGTNGEMVLGNKDGMTACSTAAGPALEGGRISCGMRGGLGAIDHVWIREGQIECSVIGGGKAKGICGSGLIDAVAVMLDLGILNKRGRIEKDYEEENGQRVFRVTENIFLTQEDIREVQMAKGAIAAGIKLMLKEMNIEEKDVDHLILCGAFGTYMNPKSASRIGLIPETLLAKVEAGGNGAGMGACMLAMDGKLFMKTDEIVSKIQPLELSSIPIFQRTFAQEMTFKMN